MKALLLAYIFICRSSPKNPLLYQPESVQKSPISTMKKAIYIALRDDRKAVAEFNTLIADVLNDKTPLWFSSPGRKILVNFVWKIYIKLDHISDDNLAAFLSFIAINKRLLDIECEFKLFISIVHRWVWLCTAKMMSLPHDYLVMQLFVLSHLPMSDLLSQTCELLVRTYAIQLILYVCRNNLLEKVDNHHLYMSLVGVSRLVTNNVLVRNNANITNGFLQTWIYISRTKFKGFSKEEVIDSIRRFSEISHRYITGLEDMFLDFWIPAITEKAGTLDKKEISISIYGFGKIIKHSGITHARSASIIRYLVLCMEAVQKQIGDLDEQDLINVIWGLRKIFEYSEKIPEDVKKSFGWFLIHWMSAANEKVQEFNEQSLKDTMWCFGNMVMHIDAKEDNMKQINDFLTSWVLAAEKKISRFDNQCLSDSIWGLANIAVHVPVTEQIKKSIEYFLDFWMSEAIQKLESFNNQNIDRCIYGIKKLCTYSNNKSCEVFIINLKRMKTIMKLKDLKPAYAPWIQSNNLFFY